MYAVSSDQYYMNHSGDRIIESYQYARSETDSDRMEHDEDRYASEIAWPY
jgi:hypothetical protein